MQESGPIISTIAEKKERKIFPKVGKILGAGILAGGLAIGADQVWDQYNETQEHRDREEKRERNIQMTEEELEKSTRNLLTLDNNPEFREIIENSTNPDILKSVDSLESLLQDLEEQKKTGTVSYETLSKISTITENLTDNVDVLGQGSGEITLTLNSINENVEEFSRIEKTRELAGYIDSFLLTIKDKNLLESLSKHPAATKRILESIERYKATFAEYFVDQNLVGQHVISSVDSTFHYESDENNRAVSALVAMQRDGIVSDFFQSLGLKINMALIAGRFDNKISFAKNFAECAYNESLNWIIEDPSNLIKYEEELGRASTPEEAANFMVASMLYYDGYDFFMLFSNDNLEEVNDLVEDITRNKDLSDEEKEKLIQEVREFGENIRNFIIGLEEAEK